MDILVIVPLYKLNSEEMKIYLELTLLAVIHPTIWSMTTSQYSRNCEMSGLLFSLSSSLLSQWKEWVIRSYTRIFFSQIRQLSISLFNLFFILPIMVHSLTNSSTRTVLRVRMVKMARLYIFATRFGGRCRKYLAQSRTMVYPRSTSESQM